MSKPLIKEIHLLVYPYWSWPSENRLKKWNSFIDEIKKDNSKLLILVETPIEVEKELFEKEKTLILKLKRKLGDRFLQCTRDNFPFSVPAFLKKHSFGENIVVRSYGQHANLCVKERNNALLEILKKLFPKIKIKNIMSRADSIKNLDEEIIYLAKLINPNIELSNKELEKLKIFAEAGQINVFKLRDYIKETLKERKEKLMKAKEKSNKNKKHKALNLKKHVRI